MKCLVCGIKFKPYYFLQKTCSSTCRDQHVKDKPVKKINRVSKKRAVQESLYSKLRKVFLNRNPYCERCNKASNEVHHKKGRVGELLIRVDFFMAICRLCHIFVHANPEESKKQGWVL